MTAFDRAESLVGGIHLFNVFPVSAAVTVFVSLQNIERHFKFRDLAH